MIKKLKKINIYAILFVFILCFSFDIYAKDQQPKDSNDILNKKTAATADNKSKSTTATNKGKSKAKSTTTTKPKKTKPQQQLDTQKDKIEPKQIVDPITQKTQNLERSIMYLENQINDLAEKDKLIKNQKEYFQILKTLENAKNELNYKNVDLASELFEKARILLEKIKINIQVETIILKNVKIIMLNGKVDIFDDKEKIWQPAVASLDRLLKPNQKIRTGEFSNAVISFEDGTIITLQQNTELEIKRSVFDIRNNTLFSKINLLRGYINCIAKDKPPIKTVNEIECMDALFEYTGSVGISVDDVNVVRVENYTGVLTALVRNEKIQLNTVFGMFINPGASASKPVKLLNPPRLFGPTDKVFIKNSRPELKWQIIEQAEKYLVQISNDETFKSIIFEELTNAAVLQPSALLDGRYFWRVIALDKNGLRSYPSEERMFIIDTIAPMISIAQPLDDQLINEKFVTIHGFTEPGRKIKINQYTIIPDKNGEFKYNLGLNRGTNIICFAAEDAAGNISKIYRMIHVDYEKQFLKAAGKIYSKSNQWSVSAFGTTGSIIINDMTYEVKQGDWSSQLKLKRGKNTFVFSLANIGYKEFEFIYDDEKPTLKSMQIIPEMYLDNARLTFYLNANDDYSPLAPTAKIIVVDKNDTAKRYEVDMKLDNTGKRFVGYLEAEPQIVKKELLLAFVSVSDIIGNERNLTEETVDLPGKPSMFWERIKTNYKQLGLPLFILSAGGVFFSL